MADSPANRLPDNLVIANDTIFIVSDPDTNIAYRVSAQTLREEYFRNYVFFKNFLIDDFTFDQLNSSGTDPTISTITNSALMFDYYQWTTTSTNAEVTFKLFDDFEADFTPEVGFVHINFHGGMSFAIPSGTDVEVTFKLQVYTGSSDTPSDSDFTDISSVTRSAEYFVPDRVDHELPAGLLSSPIEIVSGSIPWQSGNMLRGLLIVKTLEPVTTFADDFTGVARTNAEMAVKTLSLELFQPVI